MCGKINQKIEKKDAAQNSGVTRTVRGTDKPNERGMRLVIDNPCLKRAKLKSICVFMTIGLFGNVEFKSINKTKQNKMKISISGRIPFAIKELVIKCSSKR